MFNLIGKGAIFGEIALLDGRPRTADAVAITDCDLFVIERRDFLPLMREEPEITFKLIEILCARLRQSPAGSQKRCCACLKAKARLASELLLIERSPSR